MRAATPLLLLALGACALAGEGSIEKRALEALVKDDANELRALRDSIAALDSATRAGLRVRVRRGEVELRYTGLYPNVALGGAPRGETFTIEYLAGPAGVREDELLLALSGGELARIEALGEALGLRRARGSGGVSAIRMAWVERGRARVEDLRDVLAPSSRGEAARFYRGLRVVRERGLGSDRTLTADAARLPRGRVRAELSITIRLRPRPKRKKGAEGAGK